MKSTDEVIQNSGIPAKLVRAVVKQTGKENLEDIARHGVGGGFCGFVYYNDTVAFFKRNRAEIVELVSQMADSLGEPAAEMVAGFGCLAGHSGRVSDPERRKAISEYLPSVYRCLGGGRLNDDDTRVANALAWFAAEEVARAFCDE